MRLWKLECLNNLYVKKLCLLYLLFYGNGYYVLLGIFPLPGIVNSKPVDGVPAEATSRNVRVDWIKVKVLLTGILLIGILHQTFCEVPLLPECNYRDWHCIWLGNVSLTSTVKQKVCKSSLQARLLGRAEQEPVRLPDSTQRWIEGGVLAGTESVCGRPMWIVDWGLRQKPVSTPQRWLLGLSTGEFPGLFTILFSDINWSYPMTEGHKMILKPEIPITSRVMSEKCSNGDGRTQKSSIIRWKCFSQDGAAWGDRHEEGASLLWGLNPDLCEQLWIPPLGQWVPY